MPLRIVGALTILVAATLAAFAISSYQGSREMVDLMTTPPATWNLPASPELFMQRSALSDGVLLVSACLASVAGFGMLWRKSWPIYLLTTAALVAFLFPWATAVLPDDYRFRPPGTLGPIAGSTLGLLASLEWMFRRYRNVDA